MTRRVVEAVENIPSMPILEEHDQENRVGLLLVTGDRGLAGPFNSQIIRAGNRRAGGARGGRQGGRVVRLRPPRRVVAVTSAGYDVAGAYTGFTDRPAYANAREIADDLVQHYIDNELDRVEVIYNHYVSPLTQEVSHETLLPLQQIDGARRGRGGRGRGRGRRRRGRRARPRGSTSPSRRRFFSD